MRNLVAILTAASCALLACCFGLAPLVGHGADKWSSRDERSPFTDVRWRGSLPEVKVDRAWYELLAMDDLSAARLVEACKAADPKDWKKRFEEDLLAVFKRIEVTCGDTVELKVRDLKSGRETTLEHVPMTKEN